MREIKLRAWDKIDKRMFNVLSWSHPLYLDGLVEVTGQSSDCVHGHCGSDCILMQFTGLKDKSNTEIYEGDIIRFNWGSECSNCHKTPTWFGKVTFGSLGARVQGFLIADPQNNILGSVEVIGNVYKNPELLESS